MTAYGEEVGNERLGEFGPYLASVLVDPTFGNINVPELERGDRAVASAGQDRKRD